MTAKKAEYREDLPVPKRTDTESRIRILYAGVCSTDREVLKGYRPDFHGIMGHEFVGVVEESPDPSLTGKMVVGELNARMRPLHLLPDRQREALSGEKGDRHGREGWLLCRVYGIGNPFAP